VLPGEVETPVRGPLITPVALEELGESLRFLSAEPDDSTRLTPWFLERVTHISDDGLSRRLPQALECSPTLPGRFQARGRAFSTCD
jgi:hypothetical protein